MNKTDLTTAFEQTSFLYGGNAQYIEQLYAKYLENPAAVDSHWRQFFAGLEDNAAQAKQQVEGPSWQRKDWPRPESGDLVSALDGRRRMTGALLGRHPLVRKHVGLLAIGIVVLPVLPVVWGAIRGDRASRP